MKSFKADMLHRSNSNNTINNHSKDEIKLVYPTYLHSSAVIIPNKIHILEVSELRVCMVCDCVYTCVVL